MLVAVPVVHRLEPLERMANREFGAFGENVEILVGDDRRDLQDRIVAGIEPGHLQIDPDQVVLVQHCNVSSSMSAPPPRDGHRAASLAGDRGFVGRRAARLRCESGSGRTMQTFLWHDYETFGADPRRDRPAQFAAIRTTMDLDIVGEPVSFYCKPAPDVLPDPGACLVTGITPQRTQAEGVIEAEFAARVHEPLAEPGTCGVGYNSLRFDDEFTRHLLYRNFYDPYAREWENGNSRWDLIDLARMCYALRPHGIEWPRAKTASPSFRLEDLARANHVAQHRAHDALVRRAGAARFRARAARYASRACGTGISRCAASSASSSCSTSST